jgi:hypothetical protein
MSIFNLNSDVDKLILSFLDRKEVIKSLEQLNKVGNTIANNIKHNASKTITIFLKKVISEKKAIRYIISMDKKILSNSDSVLITKISKSIAKKYIIKCYKEEYKQKALTYFICNITRNANIRAEINSDVEKMLMFVNFFMDAEVRIKLMMSLDLLETHTQNGIHYMFDYFIKYSIIYS